MVFGVSLLVNVRFQVIVFSHKCGEPPTWLGWVPPPSPPLPQYLISNFLLGSVAENL